MSEPVNRSLIPTNEHGAASPKDHGQLYRMAEQLANSDLVPKPMKGRPADVFLVCQMGAELGFSMAQSLKAIHVINGSPSMSAESMGALVLASGLLADQKVWITGTGKDMAAHIMVKRKDIPTPQESSFSMEDAKAAGLSSNPNYSKYPVDMLTARAKARAYRILFPDVVKNISASEELADLPAAAPRLADAVASGTAPVQSEISPILRRKVEAESVTVAVTPPAEPVPPDDEHFDADSEQQDKF